MPHRPIRRIRVNRPYRSAPRALYLSGINPANFVETTLWLHDLMAYFRLFQNMPGAGMGTIRMHHVSNIEGWILGLIVEGADAARTDP